jgi:DNA-directed RNA polymerase subunit RPC12/RpoP
MSSQAGSDCPECGGQLETTDGVIYVCRSCGREFDAADVFLV